MKMYARFKDVDKGDRSFFTFSKTVVFPGPIHQRKTDEKYEALKNESFEYIHIPNFTYSIDDNKITYDIEFIKGTQLNPISFMVWSKKSIKILQMIVNGDFMISTLKILLLRIIPKNCIWLILNHLKE